MPKILIKDIIKAGVIGGVITLAIIVFTGNASSIQQVDGLISMFGDGFLVTAATQAIMQKRII
jgi:hypothetical protein